MRLPCKAGPSVDALDIAMLIYRTCGNTYSKEELYYPDTIEQALRNDDSDIGEVGEALVDVNHRRRGLMTRMLEALIERAEEEGLLGVYDGAVTAHKISQRANARFDFVSTGLQSPHRPAPPSGGAGRGARPHRPFARADLEDTEALAALWELQDDGGRVTVYDPPPLFHEMIGALDLESVFAVEMADSS